MSKKRKSKPKPPTPAPKTETPQAPKGNVNTTPGGGTYYPVNIGYHAAVTESRDSDAATASQDLPKKIENFLTLLDRREEAKAVSEKPNKPPTQAELDFVARECPELLPGVKARWVENEKSKWIAYGRVLGLTKELQDRFVGVVKEMKPRGIDPIPLLNYLGNGQGYTEARSAIILLQIDLGAGVGKVANDPPPPPQPEKRCAIMKETDIARRILNRPGKNVRPRTVAKKMEKCDLRDEGNGLWSIRLDPAILSEGEIERLNMIDWPPPPKMK